MNDRMYDIIIGTVLCSVCALIFIILVYGIFTTKPEASIEEQIKICIENGGTPNVYIDKKIEGHPQKVECSWTNKNEN